MTCNRARGSKVTMKEYTTKQIEALDETLAAAAGYMFEAEQVRREEHPEWDTKS